MKTVSSKGGKRAARADTIDGYLATLPEDARAALAGLRQTIKAAAPKATEVISYQIPTFKHQGMLVAFAAFEGHCGFYIMSEKVLRAHDAEIKEYELNKASIRFPASKPLPAALVTKLVKARIAENEARLPPLVPLLTRQIASGVPQPIRRAVQVLPVVSAIRLFAEPDRLQPDEGLIGAGLREVLGDEHHPDRSQNTGD